MLHKIGFNSEMEAKTNLDDSVDYEDAILAESIGNALTDGQRILVFITITFVAFVAICGNLLVIYVNLFIR